MITGINGTYNSTAATQFNLYVDAGANVGEAPQAQVIYDMLGDGTDVRTEQYSYFATNPVVDWEDYAQNSQGGIETAHTSGTFGNMTNGTVTIKVWDALPGGNAAPISLSVGSTSGAVSDLIIPFTNVTQTVSTSAPSAPTNLLASGASSSTVALSWTASATAGVTYSVYRGTSSGFTPGTPIASKLSTVSYTDTGLTESTTYYYIVAAVNTVGSADSAQASATTLASGSGTAVNNTLYLTGGATATVASALSFTDPAAGVDSIPVNSPQSPDTPANPLVYSVTGLTGTYNSTSVTQFDLYVDAGANAGEAPQVQVIYDLKGDGTVVRKEQYSYFATDAAVGWEDYAWNTRGGIESGNTTGTLGNMTNGTVTIKVWEALPGANSAPISLSVGSTSGAISNLVIPFTNLTQVQLPAAPTNVQANAVSSSSVDLTWTASITSGVTYNVYRSTTSGFTPDASALLGNVSTESFNDTGLTASTTYYYVVSSVTSSGSAAAAQVSATTPAATLITPTVSITPKTSTITTSDSLPLTITVSSGSGNPTPTGSITLSSGSYTSAATALSGGIARITIAAGSLTTGAGETITATYSPDSASTSTYNGATGTASATVNATVVPVSPTVSVTPATSTITTADSLALTITVSGGTSNPTPTGSITLSSGSYTSAATALSGGIAKITIAAGSLLVGNSETITATYTPDSASTSTYNGATGTASATVSTAVASGFVLTNSGNITISPGATSANTSTITVTPSDGFTGTVNLSCAVTTALTNPTDAVTCTLGSVGTASTSVSVSGSTPVTATLTALSTAQSSNASMPLKGFLAGGGTALAALLLFGIPARRRSWKMLLGCFLLATMLGSSVGCGGSSTVAKSGGTSAGAYLATVTGTDAATGKITSSTVVTVTVN
jgi:hypothetical protein